MTFFSLREAQAVFDGEDHRPDIVVSVSGAVVRPGVLRLSAQARAIHAVEACGGLTAQADREALELARPLHDGDHLVVGQKKLPEGALVRTEQPPGESAPPGDSSVSEGPSRVAAESEDSGRAAQRVPRPRRERQRLRAAETLSAPLDVNRASLQELVNLPGVGPVLAQRIISARDSAPGGTFSSLEELETIRGIKGKTLARLRPHLKLERP